MKKLLALIFLFLSLIQQAYAADPTLSETPDIQFTTGISSHWIGQKASDLGMPVSIYEYVHNNTEYALYHGARSGSLNTSLGLRGNDVDLSAMLIAMLRSQNIPSRYVVGTVRMSSSKVMRWLKVENADLAASLMKDQGIQKVVLSTDKTTIDFEHTWVEAMIAADSYRGTKSSTTNCIITPNACNWLPLDPSFKQYQYNKTSIDPYSSLSFDYTSYYNAIKNNDLTRRDKNPLEIYQEQVLNWLKTAAPGKTLEDISDYQEIIAEQNGLLPNSPPFIKVDTPRRYNSVADHDAAVPSIEAKNWNKTANITVSVVLVNGQTQTYPAGSASLIDLATKTLTVSTETVNGTPDIVVRLGGVEKARPLSIYALSAGTPFTINLTMDRTPASTAGGTDTIISTSYSATVGGYYLVATGGENSNHNQVYLAANQLLLANQQFLIVFNPGDPGTDAQHPCDLSTHINCTPYLDANNSKAWDATDPKLADNLVAMDTFTKDMLNVAAREYFERIRETINELDKLNKIKTPIEGFLGVVSSTNQTEYIDGTAYSILPGGLLIDIKGVKVGGSWRIDQAASNSNSQFELIVHAGSSLEHEIWQELTGYDAISTVRGIQMALASDTTTKLLNPKRNATVDNLPSLYTDFGYSTTAPTGFTKNSYTIFGKTYYAWSNPAATASFYMFSPNTQGILDPNNQLLNIINYSSGMNIDAALANYQSSYNFLSSLQTTGNLSCGGQTYTNQPRSVLLNALQTCFNSYVATWPNYFALTNPNTSLEFRAIPAANTNLDLQTTITVATVRNNLNFRDVNDSWYEYLIPSKLSLGPNYRFEVDIRKAYDATSTPANQLFDMTFEIQNMNGVPAGGGYVDGTQTLTPSTAIALPAAAATPLPTFNNATLNSQNTIAEANNHIIKTPSTADPVSTVTGNNYHDETDIAIKGRGLNMAFTRTYNSAPSSTKLDKGLGFGWVHSYGMTLKSNDYGNCPDCTSTQDPVNGNNKTSSITYTDERGGDHNYLVNETTFAVTPPAGEFDALAFNTPVSGQHTLTFRSGVKYIFEGASNINTAINVKARLKQIIDPYGNQLNFTYNANGKLATVTDNLAIAGRTGLVLTYDATNHLQKVSDWSGRNWSYVVDANSNLTSMTNPLGNIMTYSYGTDSGNTDAVSKPHQLHIIAMPMLRNGSYVGTAFDYYRNDKTFEYYDALGNFETLDYDLYRKTTRVTDPRGGIRTYEYDQSGRMTKLIEPDGAELFFSNTPTDGLRYSKTDGLGYQTQYSYKADKTFNTVSDTSGNVTREQDALLQNMDTTFGIYDQAATVTDHKGIIHTNTYYTTNGTCAVAGKLQNVKLSALTINGTAYTNVLLEDYCWSADGTLASKNTYIDPAVPTRKRVTTYTYQAGSNGLNLSQISVSGSGTTISKTFVYDNLGRKTSETLQRATSATNAALLNLTTSFEYDALDRNTAVIDGFGDRMETVYDANGKVYQMIARYKNGATFNSRTLSTRTYDAADRLITDTDVYGKITTYTYDAAGNVLSVTDANNHVTQYEYDEMNRRTAMIDANGSRSTTTYDLAGRPIAMTNANNQTTTSTYDKIGRLTQVTDAKGYITQLSYDANNNLICSIDANAQAGLQPKNSNGCTEYRIYDELNRVVQVNDALNGQNLTAYNLLGNITSVKDPSAKITSYTYDDLGRLTQTTDPLAKLTSTTYDQAGNPLTVTNRLGQITRMTYDILNRLVKTEYLTDGKTDNITYDIYGNQTIISNGNVTYTLLHDNKNRLLSKTDNRAGGKSLSFTYDAVDNILTKTDYQGYTTQYVYDSTNQLVSLKNPDYLEASYQTDGAGRQLSRTLSDGAQTGTTYDVNGWPLSLKQISANGSVVDSTTYTRDRVGNILTQTSNEGTTTYSYDALYRLTSADYPGTTFDENFTYDSVDNRITQTQNGTTHAYEYFANSNRLKAIHTGSLVGAIEKSYTYDDEGRMLSQTGGTTTNPAKTLTWDQQDHAKNIITSPINASSKAISYQYDPLDYRINSAGSSTGNQDYYLEGEHLEAIYSGLQVQSSWLRGSHTDELLAGWVKQTDNTLTPYIYHHDNQNSVSAISGHEGSVLEQINYSAFGTARTDTGNTVTINSNPMKYTGREQDADTGLYYYRARYYDKDTGRFISEDPLGFQAGINFYAYVNNNPVNANDPSGMRADVFATPLPNGQQGFSYTAVGPTGASYPTMEANYSSVLRGTFNTTTDNGGKGPIRAGDYTLSPRAYVEVKTGLAGLLQEVNALYHLNRSGDVNKHEGMPVLSNTNETNLIKYNDGSVRTNITIHPGRDPITGEGGRSLGCFVCNTSDFNGLNQMLQNNYNNGGSYFHLAPTPYTDSPSIYNNGAGAGTFGSIDSFGGAAAGGYLLYPNKPNNNQMQSVYSK